MPTVAEILSVTPAPVDLRMWSQDCLLGWKTPEQVQAEMDAAPESPVAKRMAALSLVQPVVYKVLLELDLKEIASVLMLTQHRAVMLYAHDLFKDQRLHALSLYLGTSVRKRERVLKKFGTERAPVLLCHWPAIGFVGIGFKTEVVVIDGPPDWDERLGEVLVGSRVRVVEPSAVH